VTEVLRQRQFILAGPDGWDFPSGSSYFSKLCDQVDVSDEPGERDAYIRKNLADIKAVHNDLTKKARACVLTSAHG
jgi:hypothetical protein